MLRTSQLVIVLRCTAELCIASLNHRPPVTIKPAPQPMAALRGEAWETCAPHCVAPLCIAPPRSTIVCLND
jgi:hypothetical protein